MLTKRAFKDSSLCVVGNINRDIKTAPLVQGHHLFQDGETSISWVSETIGGGGANSAFAAALLGASVAFAGKVGVDGLGSRLRRTLLQYGVREHLAKDPRASTGTSIALAFDTGRRHFISCLPASEALTFDDIDLAALDQCDHLFRADIWFSDSMLYEGNRALFKIAKERGLAVSIDLNWDPRWGSASAREIRARKRAVRSLLPLVDLAHGNARELIEFSDASDLGTALKRLGEWGASSVVVHLGERGAGFFDGDVLSIEPPVPVKSQVNMTGTGDVLSVCMMLLHRCSEISIKQRLRLANSIVSCFIQGRLELIPKLAE